VKLTRSHSITQNKNCWMII